MSTFNEWLNSNLETIGLNDEVYSSYVQGIMEEQTSTTEEKVEGIIDFLQAATVSFDHFYDC